jgi:methionyl-tRNA formyltransferase
VSAAVAGEAVPAAAGTASRPLRVVFCTRGGWFGELVLARLRASERIELCGIVRSSRVYHREYGFLRGALAYLRRSGLAYSLYLLCATDITEAVYALTGARRALRKGKTLSSAAGQLRIPAHTTRDLNDARGVQFLRSCAPDLLVSAFFDQPLREAALAVAARGNVNIHPSLLPAFRGVDPVLQARLRRAQTGVTIHYMTPVLDAGNILRQEVIEAPSDGSIFTVTALLFDRGAQLLVEALDGIRRGDPGVPQPEGGSYESWPTRGEIRALRSVGNRLMRLSDLTRCATPPASQSPSSARR